MGRRRFRSGANYVAPPSLSQLQSEMHYKQSAADGGSGQPATYNLALGRLVSGDALRPAQQELMQTAQRLGFTVTRRWANLGVSYVSWHQLSAVGEQRPGCRIPESASDMLPTVRRRYDEAMPARGQRIFDTIPDIGKLVLGFESRRRGANQSTVMHLRLRDADVIGRVSDERVMVLNALSPNGDAAEVLSARKALTIPLIEVDVANDGSGLRRAAILQEPPHIPYRVDLESVDSFDFVAEPIR